MSYVNEAMRTLSLAAAALVVVCSASDAEAKCAAPGAHFEPASGAVPVSAVVRMFVPPHQLNGPPAVTALDAAGKPVATTIATESTSDAFNSYRIAFAAKSGTVTLRFAGKYGAPHEATYAIDPTYAAPKFTPPKLTLTRVQTSWTCSHQLTRNITFPSVAPAYRLTFANNKAALAGSKDSVVLPAETRTLFGYYASSAGADLALGHVNCMGTTYTWKSGQWARITALFPDGSEAEVTPAVWLDPP